MVMGLLSEPAVVNASQDLHNWICTVYGCFHNYGATFWAVKVRKKHDAFASFPVLVNQSVAVENRMIYKNVSIKSSFDNYGCAYKFCI